MDSLLPAALKISDSLKDMFKIRAKTVFHSNAHLHTLDLFLNRSLLQNFSVFSNDRKGKTVLGIERHVQWSWKPNANKIEYIGRASASFVTRKNDSGKSCIDPCNEL